VLDAEKYGDGKTGRGNWDIVHTIPYCIGVLRGEIAADNLRKITKAIAVILLAHYLGDIHQPLHVGAEYFNEAGEPIDPDRGAPGLGDEGGNALTLVQNATAGRKRHYYHSFHAYWDLDTVRNLTIGTPDEVPKEERENVYAPAKEKVIADFVASEPKNWRTPMRFSRSHARRTPGCDLSTFIARRKMVAFLPKEKRTKSGLATSIGQPLLSATNYTRPVGAWRICCKKFCSRVSMRRVEIFRQARTLALQETRRLRLRRDHIRSSFSS